MVIIVDLQLFVMELEINHHDIAGFFVWLCLLLVGDYGFSCCIFMSLYKVTGEMFSCSVGDLGIKSKVRLEGLVLVKVFIRFKLSPILKTYLSLRSSWY